VSALGHDKIADLVIHRCPSVAPLRAENGRPFLLVPKADLPGVARYLRDDPALRFDALMDLTGYDLMKYPAAQPSDAIAVVLLLFSYQRRHEVTLKVHAERADCTVPTVSAIWPAALYFEREVYDLLGVRFAGHPSLGRILCPDDWEGHPLRKDYVYPGSYHGIAHLREGQHFEASPPRHGQPVAGQPPLPLGGHK
jgi:NADH-quinone oxidoreductase subunit C